MLSQVLYVFALSVVLLLGQVTVSTATHMPLPPDNNIHMSINGTEVTLPTTNCTSPICTVNIASAYTVGAVTVTITKLTTTSDARIQSDDSTDQLLMRNVKITTNTSNLVTILFWRKFAPVSAPGTNTTWYYEGHGGGKILKNNNWGAPNAKIVFRGYVEKDAGLATATNISLGNLSLPASCPTDQPQLKFCVPSGTPTSSAATFSWSNGYFRTTSQIMLDRGVARILTGYIELTLPIPANGDSLQMPDTTTAGLQVQGNSSPGQGSPHACDSCTGEQCATCVNCPEGTGDPSSCKPKSQVSSFCMTSFSSSTGPTSSTQCPNCITVDGQIAQSAKVPLFVKSNWDNLLTDMARGQGEHLASLADLLGVPREQYPAFFVITQEEYSSLSLYDKVAAPEVMISSLRERWAAQSGLVSMAVQPVD